MNVVYVLHFILFRKLFILNVTISIDRVGNVCIAVSHLLMLLLSPLLHGDVRNVDGDVGNINGDVGNLTC